MVCAFGRGYRCGGGLMRGGKELCVKVRGRW